MRIALIEDDPLQADQMSHWLVEAGHHCHRFANGASFARAIRSESFDLILMDWGLPDISGFELLSKVREDDQYTPIVFITSRDSELDIVAALQHGADDYLIKPVRAGETLARIDAVNRRTHRQKQDDAMLRFEPYTLDCSNGRVNFEEQSIQLTHKEFELTKFLFQNHNRLLSRNHILETVWGLSSDITTRTVDAHVSKIRRKLQLTPERGWRLSSVYQYGYRLESINSESLTPQ